MREKNCQNERKSWTLLFPLVFLCALLRGAEFGRVPSDLTNMTLLSKKLARSDMVGFAHGTERLWGLVLIVLSFVPLVGARVVRVVSSALVVPWLVLVRVSLSRIGKVLAASRGKVVGGVGEPAGDRARFGHQFGIVVDCVGKTFKVDDS